MSPTRSLLVLAVLAALPVYALAAPGPEATTATADKRDVTVLDTINVVGTGETRQVQELGREEIASQPAGTSPLKLMAKLPGVHFTAADPWGVFEWSTRLSIRGFNQLQLGFVLDGIPLGDMSFGNHNGLHISRALIAENLGFLEVSQGSGSLDTASTSNLGGTVRFSSRRPQAQREFTFAQTVGSDDTFRTFVRYDTGDINGFSAFLSGVRHEAQKWRSSNAQRGAGDQTSDQINAQIRYTADTWSIGGLINTSRTHQIGHADLSLDSARRLGMRWDNYAPDWQHAIDAARGVFRGGVNNVNDAYYRGGGGRDDELYALNAELAFTDTATFRGQVYRHTNEGQGHWVTPFRPSSPTLPLSLRTTEYLIDRRGATASIELALGAHTLEFGLWTEGNEHNLQRNFYNLNIDSPPNRIFWYRDPDLRVFEQDFDSDTLTYFVRDRIELLDGRLVVDAGFKGIDHGFDVVARIGHPRFVASGRIEAKDSFLPQLGLRYEIAEGFEVFGSYAENMAAFRAGLGGPFSATQAAFDAIRPTLRPETSTTLESGLRWRIDGFQSSLTLYRVDFSDRLLTISRDVGILGLPSALANVGAVETSGAELAMDWTVSEGLSLFTALSWNDSKYADDYLDGRTLIRTSGKRVVDAPERMFNAELHYAIAGWDLRIGGKYTDDRHITFLNDSKVDAFWLADASIGYDFGGFGWAKQLKATLNVTNLFDEEYFASLGILGYRASDPQGLNYTLSTGAPRQVFLTFEARF